VTPQSQSAKALHVPLRNALKEPWGNARVVPNTIRLMGCSGDGVAESATDTITTLSSGSRVEVIDDTNRDAILVQLPDGRRGCVKAEELLQDKVEQELRTKCAPFANGSVTRVQEKTMLLPPRECRQILPWMRDAYLDALYDLLK
jgi:hypothetical protein